MGQDREFTDEQRRFVLSTVRRYQQAWEKAEEKALTDDRDVKLRMMTPVEEGDGENEENQKIADEIERIVEEYQTAHQEDLPEDTVAREGILQKVRLQAQAKQFFENYTLF